MIARNVTLNTLENAAYAVGVRLIEVRQLTRNTVQFRLGLDAKEECWDCAGNGTIPSHKLPNGSIRCGKCKGTGKQNRYQRTSASYYNRSRRVAAVCWHGHRDFFRGVYRIAPDAVIRTALATYKDADDFEYQFPATGEKNIGPPISPLRVSDACECAE